MTTSSYTRRSRALLGSRAGFRDICEGVVVIDIPGTSFLDPGLVLFHIYGAGFSSKDFRGNEGVVVLVGWILKL
jgi:hypothetical protein